MASNSEIGHKKNIENAKKLNEFIVGYGASYNPTNALLIAGAMTGQQSAADVLQQNVNSIFGAYQPFQNARVAEFKTLKPLARRVRSAAKSCGATVEWNKDVNAVVRKILGERATPATPAPGDPAGTSASQQSFDNQIDHLDRLIGLLQAEPLYVPNEVDLQVASLLTKKSDMISANDNAKAVAVPLANSIIERNVALYGNTQGLVDVFQTSKSYIKSVFGASSPQFKLVSKIEFKKVVKIPT